MSIHPRHAAVLAAVGLLVGLLPAAASGTEPSTTAAPAATPTAALPSDFNGDGFVDLAIGVPGEDVGGFNAAGAVNVLYGGATGLTAAGDQLWTQNSAGVLDQVSDTETFGRALASGDFDRDGYADLAVGVPGESVDETHDAYRAGAVSVLYGTSRGLTASGNQLWTGFEISGAVHFGATFGSALAAADFDADGYADLAIGEPWGSVGGVTQPGEVGILFGGPDGLAATRALHLSQATEGVPGVPLEGESFGAALAAADFDADGHADLAIGVSEDSLADVPYAGEGAVNVVYGSAAGFELPRSELWNQDSPSVPGVARQSEAFGTALAAGDFDADGHADLAIGVPGEDVKPGGTSQGAVNLLYGSAAGLTGAGSQLWHSDVAGVPGASENGDRFGASLAAGDVDGDGAHDLAVGAPYETLGSRAGYCCHGAVTVLHGGVGGLGVAGATLWTEDTPGVPGSAERNDGFGKSLAIANYGRSAAADLAIGTPTENGGSVANTGAVVVLYGRSTGLSATGSQGWSQNSSGVLGTAERNDIFGATLAP